MLKRITAVRKYFYGLLTVIVLLSSVYSYSIHVSVNRGDSAVRACESVCLSHSQSNVVQNIFDSTEEDDKDPIPPAYTIASRVIMLGTFGVAFSIVLALCLYELKYLRLQQLRF